MESCITPKKSVCVIKSITSLCILCNSDSPRHLRIIGRNQALQSTYVQLIETVLGTNITPVLYLKPKICDTCVRHLTRILTYSENCKQNVNELQRMELQERQKRGKLLSPSPIKLTGKKFKSMTRSKLFPVKVLCPHKDVGKENVPDSGCQTSSIHPSESSNPAFKNMSESTFSDSREHSYAQPEPVDQVARGIVRNSGLSSKAFEHASMNQEKMPTSLTEGVFVRLLLDLPPVWVARIIVDNKSVLKEIEKEQLATLDSICDKLCSLTKEPGPSVLRMLTKAPQLANEDLFARILVEMKQSIPFILDLFITICRPLHVSSTKCMYTVASMYAMAMYMRNHQLSALQRLNTAALVRYHANNELLSIFNKCAITLSESSKIPLLGEFGEYNLEGVQKSLKRGVMGKITVDNIDGLIISNHIRQGLRNRSYHYTHATYIPDRFDVSALGLPNCEPQGKIDMNKFYLNDEETVNLKKMYKYHIGRILSATCSSLSWMSRCIPTHIPHDFSDVMAQKSEVFPLQVFLRDPKYYGECVLVMDALRDIMETAFINVGRGEEYKSAFIPLGGDQLVRVRFQGAKGLRRGVHTREEELQIFSPVTIEMLPHITGLP